METKAHGFTEEFLQWFRKRFSFQGGLAPQSFAENIQWFCDSVPEDVGIVFLNGSEVVLWRLTGAGHGWPGHGSVLGEGVTGPHTEVIDATEEIWKFFRSHHR